MVFITSCAQSGNGRRNSNQRKINQQEESCQNLTDFTAARVPSNLDIFTAYNETLQCSHECVRGSMPVYSDQGLHQSTVYKTTFNGNRSQLTCQPEHLWDLGENWTTGEETHAPTRRTHKLHTDLRTPPSERQLIPVPFVSEKWFEISC
ncbi:adherens junction-associated protein 1-like [Narcine bancroftii]|uniref:adherens junction-associated protein 1-like n=1 Tax=Narcine bancroftii TaxID=1343680 RepID=UPI0038312F1F